LKHTAFRSKWWSEMAFALWTSDLLYDWCFFLMLNDALLNIIDTTEVHRSQKKHQSYCKSLVHKAKAISLHHLLRNAVCFKIVEVSNLSLFHLTLLRSFLPCCQKKYIQTQTTYRPNLLNKCTKISSPDTNSCATNPAIAIIARRPLFNSLVCISFLPAGSEGSSPKGSKPKLPGS